MLTAAASIWGGMYAVSRVAMETVPPWTLLAIRLLAGGMALILLALWPGRRPSASGRTVALAAMAGALGPGLSIGLQFVGTHLTSASVGALVTSASPAFVAVFGWSLLGERVTSRHGGALAVALAGAGLIAAGAPAASPGTGGGSFAAGLACLMGAALTWALYSVLMRVVTVRLGMPALLATGVATLSGLAVALPGAVAEHLIQPGAWIGWSRALTRWPLSGSILYLALVSTALAFYLWSRGFEEMEASRASLFFLLQPLVGALLGVCVLGESAGWTLGAGGALILSGVVVAGQPRGDGGAGRTDAKEGAGHERPPQAPA